MRITRPRDWQFMSEEDQQKWAEKVGKDITEANKIMKKKMEEMKKAGVFENNTVVGYLEHEVVKADNKMKWFKGGKF